MTAVVNLMLGVNVNVNIHCYFPRGCVEVEVVVTSIECRYLKRDLVTQTVGLLQSLSRSRFSPSSGHT